MAKQARPIRGFTLRSDGLYQYRFTIKGQRFYTYGHTYEECEKKKADLIEKLKQGLLLDNDNITLSAYYDLWISRKHKIGKSTKYTIETRWARIKKTFGNTKIVDIKAIHVERFQVMLREELSTTGVNHEIELLRTILNSAIRDKIITDNPCEFIESYEREEVTAADSNHRALTLEEQSLFFKYAKDSWYYGLFAFMISTGVRIGEAAALTWADIDYRNNMIHITKTLSRISNTEWVIGKPKTKTSLRDIPLTEPIKEILVKQRETNRIRKVFNGENDIVDVSGRIFTAIEGGYVMRGSVNSSIDYVLKRIKEDETVNTEIEHFTSHAFRATFATRAIEQGMQPQTLKTIMGHSKLTITMDLYSHVLPNTKQSEMEKIVIAVG